jgi:hypothetical protein
LQEGGNGVAVVFCAELDELDGCFEVVEEAVDVGEEYLDVAARGEELCDFEDGDELSPKLVQHATTRGVVGNIRIRSVVGLL